MSLDILNKCVDLELRDFEDSEIYDMLGKRNYNIKMARVKNIRETTYINYLLSNDVGYKEMKIFNSGQY